MAGAQWKTNPVAHEEFEPFCTWKRGEDKDVLEVYLPDFRKEQLKVQISNHGVLKVSGERPLDVSRRSMFYREIPFSRHVYDTSAIQAKFVNGCLFITIPKLTHHQLESKLKLELEPDSKPKPTSFYAPPYEEDRSKAKLPQPRQPRDPKYRDMGKIIGKWGSWTTVAMTLALLVAFLVCVVYIYRSTIAGDTKE